VVAVVEVDRDAPQERVWFIEHTSNLHATHWLGDRSGPKLRIDAPSDAWGAVDRDWLALKPRTTWTVGGKTYAPDTVVGISLTAFLAGDRNFTTLFQPNGRRALQGLFWCGGRLILSILDDLRPVFEALKPSADGWSRESISGLPDLGTVSAWPFDIRPEESNGDLLAVTQDPVTPPSLFLVEPGAVPQVLKRTPQAFDASGLVVSRHEAASADGTSIPYIQVGPPGESGEAPVHLYGYGGFGISMTPWYDSALGKLWLERGGTGVFAHIRGGREFGTAWYEAARREGRRLAHDDFAAVAADLVRRGVTRPGRIAATGASNGGLLIANMLTRYPERFGALFCAVPVIDMRRFAKLLIGPALSKSSATPTIRGIGNSSPAFPPTTPRRPARPIPRSSLRRVAEMIAPIPAMPARWRQSSRRWDIRPTSTNQLPAATPWERTMRNTRPTCRSPMASCAAASVGGRIEC
jgi:prolyl oligopeptidase